MKTFLVAIERVPYYEELTRSADEWKKFIAYTPQERRAKSGLRYPPRISGRTYRSKRLDKVEYLPST